MGFLDSLSGWFKGDRPENTGGPEKTGPIDAEERARRRTSLGAAEEAEPTVGAQCLLSVTERRFMVEILELNDQTMRVSFPGIDYPVEGMIVELELHDHSGFSYYQCRVIKGPQREGDGILLARPPSGQRNRHRDSARVPCDVAAQLKDQVHPQKRSGRIRNLSTGGALLETDAAYDAGATLEMHVELPDEAPAELIVQVLHVMEPRKTDEGTVHVYGTRFVGYEPGSGRTITRFIWQRLKELYPAQ